MKFTIAALSAIAAVVSAQRDGCTTTGNASVSIIAPVKGQVLTPGTEYTITWQVVNGDAAYNALPLTLLIGNAANPNNIVPVSGGTFATNVTIGAGQAKVTVPQIPAGSNYTVEAKYIDSTKANLVCFSPQFTIAASTAPATTAAPVTTASKTSSAGQAVAGFFAGVAALLL
ncbi:hypothetical protein BDR26DRAFT_855956 [Obelidium mucronatum]|nr:hypothetical protein BDR26DRAFT_855956 [Obelidium mucronatum]